MMKRGNRIPKIGTIVLLTASLAVGCSGAVHAAPCEVEALFVSPQVDRTIKTRLIEEIDSAEEQLLIALYSFTDDDLGDAVVRAHQRGVKVYVLLDDAQDGNLLGGEWGKLVRAGISVAVEDEIGLLHHKFAIIDRTTAMTGSYDWSEPVGSGNFENVVIIECPAIAIAFVEEFLYIANDVIGLGWFSIDPSSTVSPADPCLECLARLNDADSSDFAECPGVNEALAARLVASQPFTLSGTYGRTQIEALLDEIPMITAHIARLLVDCICGDLYR